MRWLVLVGVCLVGCGEDSSRPPLAPGGDGNPGVIVGGGGPGGGEGGASGQGGDGGAGGEGGARGEDACANEEDLDALAGAERGRDVARACGQVRCLNAVGDADAYERCVTGCVETDIEGISAECASCYGVAERCSLVAFCRPTCQLNVCSDNCLTCVDDAGCIEALEACRGLPGDECI